MIIDDARELLVKATGGKYSVLAEEQLWHYVHRNFKDQRVQKFTVCILTAENEIVFREEGIDLQVLVGYAIRAVAVYEATQPKEAASDPNT